jgi:hypothetical protein
LGGDGVLIIVGKGTARRRGSKGKIGGDDWSCFESTKYWLRHKASPRSYVSALNRYMLFLNVKSPDEVLGLGDAAYHRRMWMDWVDSTDLFLA